MATPVEFKSFSGINIRDYPGRIKDSELVECQNFDLSAVGDLTKRTGFRALTSAATLGANTVTLLGYFYTDVYNQLLARVGTSVYFSTDGGDTWTICPGGPHGNVEFGVQYTNKFYLVRRDAVMLEWNGLAMTAITGSPMGSHVFAYKDRLFVLNTYAAGTLASRFYFSKIADFSATGWPSTNFIDVAPGDGDFLVVTAQAQDLLFVFKSRSTWLLYASGDPTTWTLRNASPEIGCVSRYTPREIESSLYFVGFRGVYRTDGTTFDEISEEISPVFKGQVISVVELNKTFAGWWGDKYIVFVSLITQASTWGSNESTPWSQLELLTWGSVSGAYYQGYVYYLRNQAWTRWEPASGVAPNNFVEVNQPITARGLVAGSRNPNGVVYRFGENIYQDGGVNYVCRVTTKEQDLEGPSVVKRGTFTVVEINGNGTHTFINKVNGIERPALPVVSNAGRLAYKIKGPHYFRVWQISMEAVHANPITFFGYTLYLSPKRTIIKSGV